MDTTLQQILQQLIDLVREREAHLTAIKQLTDERDKLKKELESVRNPDTKKENK